MDKRMTLSEVARAIPDGAVVAIGGSSMSRKPMALIRAIARSEVRDLTLIVDVGGPDVDLLIGCGKVRKVVYAYVGFEVFGLAPHFRRARERGEVAFEEWSEYTVMAGLDARAKRVPFLPTRAGLGSDLLEVNPAFRRIEDPFGGGPVVAVPALTPDVGLIHVNLADASGNGVILGDAHVDALIAKAATRTYMSAERLTSPEDVRGYRRDVVIPRYAVAGVVEAAWGAHMTACAPNYRADLEHMAAYQRAAQDPASWAQYLERYVHVDEEAYRAALGGTLALAGRLRV